MIAASDLTSSAAGSGSGSVVGICSWDRHSAFRPRHRFSARSEDSDGAAPADGQLSSGSGASQTVSIDHLGSTFGAITKSKLPNLCVLISKSIVFDH